jgi:hypothetical protein
MSYQVAVASFGGDDATMAKSLYYPKSYYEIYKIFLKKSKN